MDYNNVYSLVVILCYGLAKCYALNQEQLGKKNESLLFPIITCKSIIIGINISTENVKLPTSNRDDFVDRTITA